MNVEITDEHLHRAQVALAAVARARNLVEALEEAPVLEVGSEVYRAASSLRIALARMDEMEDW